MGREDQIEEREVLDSIFPDEITDVSENEYRIQITVDVPGDEEENEAPVMLLTVRYPEDYPDQAPHLELSAPQNGGAHPHFKVAEDKDVLLRDLAATVEENLGMAMVFTLVSALQEQVVQLVLDRREAAAKVHEELLLAAEREENKKFHGTPVTRETFLKWRHDFIQEMEEAAAREEEERLADMKKARIKEPPKLTGKQLWEMGLAGKGDPEEIDDEVLTEEELKKLRIKDT